MGNVVSNLLTTWWPPVGWCGFRLNKAHLMFINKQHSILLFSCCCAATLLLLLLCCCWPANLLLLCHYAAVLPLCWCCSATMLLLWCCCSATMLLLHYCCCGCCSCCYVAGAALPICRSSAATVPLLLLLLCCCCCYYLLLLLLLCRYAAALLLLLLCCCVPAQLKLSFLLLCWILIFLDVWLLWDFHVFLWNCILMSAMLNMCGWDNHQVKLTYKISYQLQKFTLLNHFNIKVVHLKFYTNTKYTFIE